MRSIFSTLQTVFLVIGISFIAIPSSQAYADDPRTWQFRSPMPTARTGVAAVALNGQVYVMGGLDAQGRIVDIVERYDPQTDTWHEAPRLRTPRYNSAAVIFEGNIFVIGGRDSTNNPLKKVEVFIPSENDWESFDNLNEEREAPAAVVIDGELYVMGGSNGSGNILDSVEFLNYDEEKWEMEDDWTLDVPRASFAYVATDDVAYSIAGYSSFGPIGLVQRYTEEDGETDLTPLSPARGALAAAWLENAIYAMGGRRSNNQVVNTVNRFFPNENRWEIAPAMNTARERFASVSIANDIFVFGGNSNNGAVLNTVEAFVTTIAPAANDDVLVTDEDVEMSINVLINDTDPAGSTLTIASFSQPDHGSVTQLDASTFSYSPATHYFGADGFTYTVRNSVGGTAQARVNVTIQSINDPPSFTSLPVEGAVENSLYSYTLVADDIENGALVFESVEVPAWLTLTDSQDGTALLEGIPTASELGEHPVTIAVSDGSARTEQSFTVVVVEGAPGETALLSPADGALDLQTSVTLSWSGTGATSFDVEVAVDTSFISPLIAQSNLAEPVFELTGLDNDTDYFWRIRGINPAGVGPWSAAFKFRTAVDTALEDELPSTVFNLLPGYPNPFSESTRFDFEVVTDLPGTLTIDIYDMRGRQIITLKNGYHSPGSYSAFWHGDDRSGRPVASGTYVVRLIHGTESVARLIMLIR